MRARRESRHRAPRRIERATRQEMGIAVRRVGSRAERVAANGSTNSQERRYSLGAGLPRTRASAIARRYQRNESLRHGEFPQRPSRARRNLVGAGRAAGSPQQGAARQSRFDSRARKKRERLTMWLTDRLLKSAATAQNIVNDPSVPLVSIVIRSMDRPTLKRAMHSAAQQTWRNIEIIVVAACGDSHRSVVETFLGRPVRLVNMHRRLPRPEAANAGLEAAQGEWIGFLDDDDELLPQHFEGLLAAPRTRKERVVF